MTHEVAQRARPLESAITVREALALDCMRGATIVAGAGGAERRIRGVNIMEDADIVRWMRGGELLLSTGYSIRDDPDALRRLAPALAHRGGPPAALVGLVPAPAGAGPAPPALTLGLSVTAGPTDVGAPADRFGFPLIALPP